LPGGARRHFSAEDIFIAETFHSQGVKKFRVEKSFRANGVSRDALGRMAAAQASGASLSS
jgi:hypothetical protein